MKLGLFLLLVSLVAIAQEDFAGRLVKKSGTVEIFIEPSDKVVGAGPHVKFENKFYTVVNDPKVGFKIPNGSVVKTGKDAKARIVYKNGDQFNVGEGTSYRIVSAALKAGGDGTSVDLLYGKLRAVISKEGPRNNMKIKTNSAVMGIRGTDFYVEKNSSLKGAEVKVLRGVVELKPNDEKAKSVKIETGFSGKAPPPTVVAKNEPAKKDLEIVAAVVVEQTSKQELVEIQEQSVIKKEEVKDEPAVDSKVAAELEKLETKAVENTLNDIKHYDPKMYEKLKEENIANVDQINTNVVKEVFTKAPDRPKKPGLDDLKKEDVYEKYFRIE